MTMTRLLKKAHFFKQLPTSRFVQGFHDRYKARRVVGEGRVVGESRTSSLLAAARMLVGAPDFNSFVAARAVEETSYTEVTGASELAPAYTSPATQKWSERAKVIEAKVSDIIGVRIESLASDLAKIIERTIPKEIDWLRATANAL